MIEPTYNTRTEHRNLVLVLIMIFYMAFFPTSINGKIISSMWAVRNFSAFFIAVYLLLKNSFLKRPFIWVFLYLSWLGVLTITTGIAYFNSSDLRVSYASISALIPTLFIWCISFNDTRMRLDTTVKIIDILSGVICTWGWLLVANYSPVVELTRSFYSQLTETMFDNMIVIRGKPVMSFGTHSMSAFYVLLFFLLNCILVREKKHSIYNYIIMALLFLLEIPMDSNTALLAMGIMLLLIIWANNNKYTRLLVVSIFIIAIVFASLKGYVSLLFEEASEMFSSSSHGITARYLTGRYTGNFRMITNYIGVGFLRSSSNSFVMNDSGIIYLLTQGNIPGLLIAYSLMYGFLRRNLNKYHVIIFGILFIWEIVSATTFVSVKMVFTQMFFIFAINGVVGEKGELLDEEYT